MWQRSGSWRPDTTCKHRRGLVLAAVVGSLLTLTPGRAVAVTVQVDRSTRYQVIDGFGFFGARDVWWGNPSGLIDPDWVKFVIDDLGMSMWRNEYYPPSDPDKIQDADWAKQRPVVEALHEQAVRSGVPLKIIMSVWSPPSGLKCSSDNRAVHLGRPHPGGTKAGGAICPDKHAAFADWLMSGLKQYSDAGVKVYALSFQNEPLFAQSYNSGLYPPEYYVATLADIAPRIHARYPQLKIFGPENMLAIECGKDDVKFDPFWYTGKIMKVPAALEQLGAFAVHGYSDGVLATPTSKAARLWQSYYDRTKSTNKPIWMTETSGYVDDWEEGHNAEGASRPGAFGLAQAILSALYYGKVAAWVWWQGSGLDSLGEFNLMRGTQVSKRYAVSKHFYRFLRPGAQMVGTTTDDPELLAASFEHKGIGNFVMVLVNGATTAKTVTVKGDDVPQAMEAVRTSSTEDLIHLAGVSTRLMVLPPRSITTLIRGEFTDPPATAIGSVADSPPVAKSVGRRSSGNFCWCQSGASPSLLGAALLTMIAAAAVARRRR